MPIDISDWEFKKAMLIVEFDDKTVDQAEGPEGLLYITLVAKRNGEETERNGTVCANGFNMRATRLFCEYMGYQVEEGSRGTHRDYKYVPE